MFFLNCFLLYELGNWCRLNSKSHTADDNYFKVNVKHFVCIIFIDPQIFLHSTLPTSYGHNKMSKCYSSPKL